MDPAAATVFTTTLVKIVLVSDLDVERNVGRIRERVAALPDQVDVAVFPEYALTGFVADERVREAALDRAAAIDRLSTIADENDVAVVAGYAERASVGSGDTERADEVYNATAYVPPNHNEKGSAAEAAVYRKRHLWGKEEEYVTPGAERVVVDTPAGSTGLLTCYDLNFVAESAWFTDRAVDALFVPGAWPAAHAANWRLLLRARALDGVRWVVGAGRTGSATEGKDEGDHQYAGNSLVARPDGRVGAELGREERDLIVTLGRETLETQRTVVGSVRKGRK